MDEEMKCRMCHGDIDNVIMVHMMWVTPDYKERSIGLSSASYALCTECATKVKNMLEENDEKA